MKLLLRWVITAAALYAAQYLVAGIDVGRDALVPYLLMAAVLGLVNVFVKPILSLLTCPLHIVTFGLFAFVVNALAFWFASMIAVELGIGFRVDGFTAAFLGSLIVSGVGLLANALLSGDR